jgi:Family of unknown function (DUF6311)
VANPDSTPRQERRISPFPRVPSLILATLLGIAFAALTLDPGYVAGTGPYWNAQTGDPAKGEIGWFYYARDAWRFPLLDIDTYHYPEGSSIVLSDSVPLFALPAKVVYKLAYAPSQRPPVYTGFWVALCLVLQAVAASRLLRALGIGDPVAQLAGVAIFCYLPMVMLRFGQASLMAQFLVIFALEYYVRGKHEGLSRRQWIALCALPPLAILVHPYLCAMCGVFVAATLLDQWRERRIEVPGVLAGFGSMAALTLVLMFVGGFFRATQGTFGDYGLYSLNLLSPFVPFATTLAGRLLGTTTPVLPGTNQWEGGAYLGAGVLLMCVLALPALGNWRANLRRHAVLFVLLVFVLVFAVSQRIGFGSHEVANLPLPDVVLRVLSTLRGSGRFVWVAVYALVAALIVAVLARYGARRARLLLVVAAVLQIADVLPMQLGVRAATAAPAPSTIDRAAWTRLIDAHRRIFVFPSFECGGLFGHGAPGTKFRELEIDWIAAERNVPINSAYLARTTKNCTRERGDVGANAGEHGLLRLYRSTDEMGRFLHRQGIDFSRCGYLDQVVVCSADMDLSALR